MGKVVPVPVQAGSGPEPAPKFFSEGPGQRSKTFSRRDRNEIFFSPGPGPKMTGPAHV
jgi:hypothetical protein